MQSRSALPLARGLPCERFTAALASRNSCITRGRGGWLDLPRGGLAPPILCQLPGALRIGSTTVLAAPKSNFRFAPESGIPQSDIAHHRHGNRPDALEWERKVQEND